MALKYIYAPRATMEKQRYDLRESAGEIQSVLTNCFPENLKDVYVDQQYFEFTLQHTVHPKHLREMGKQLKKMQTGVHLESGYLRQTQHMYAFAQWSGEYVDVELIDKGILAADFEERIAQAELYNQPGQVEQSAWVRRLYYIDVYSAQFTVQEFNSCFGESFSSDHIDENIRLYEVTLQHSRVNRDVWLTKEPFEEGETRDSVLSHKKGDWFVIEHLDTEDANYFNYFDIAKLRMINKKVSQEVRQKIEGKVKLGKLSLHHVNDSDLLPKGGKDPEGHREYIFTVHNVGQGLATSLSCPTEDPFFYFDFGLGCGRNRATVPAGVKLPIQESAIIALSHLHEDHWRGIATNIKALKAAWFIPQQPIRLSLRHQIAKILLAGGAVYYYSGVKSKHIKITHASTSSLRPCHAPSKMHETGFAMYLNAARCCSGSRRSAYTIWVSGDQHYDYQDTLHIPAPDILVACHHGGEYSESIRCKVPSPASNTSMVIYSYGRGNSHGHPSKVNDYNAAGWMSRFDTPGGDCQIKICL